MRRILAVTAVVSTLAGCARNTGPVEVPPEQLPFALRTTPGAGAGPIVAAVTVYFVREGRLEPVRRVVEGTSPADAAVRGLLQGPTAAEEAGGSLTAIPPNTEVLEVRVTGAIAEVDLSREFEAPASTERLMVRLAQVVYTLGGLPRVASVRFLVDGEPVDVLTDGGVAVRRPVTVDDYRSVGPPGTR